MMKNIFKLIALVAAAVLFIAAGGSETVTVKATDGILKVTGLAAHNGKWIIAVGYGYADEDDDDDDDVAIAEAQNITGAGIITGVPISGGSAVLKVWEEIDDEYGFGNYNGSHTIRVLAFIINKKTLNEDEWDELLDSNPDFLVEMGIVGTSGIVTFSRGEGTGMYVEFNDI